MVVFWPPKPPSPNPDNFPRHLLFVIGACNPTCGYVLRLCCKVVILPYLQRRFGGWWMFFWGVGHLLRFFLVGDGGDFKALVMLQDGRFSRNTGKTSLQVPMLERMEGNAFYRTPRGGEFHLSKSSTNIFNYQKPKPNNTPKGFKFGCPNLNYFLIST